AREAIEEALKRSRVAFGSSMIADMHFYECLILARSATSEHGLQRRRSGARIKAGIKAIAKWSRSAPSNYSAREALLRGEWARLRGDEGQALRAYNQAIARARTHRTPHIEAMAAECALRFSSTRDFPILARAYLIEAINAYRCWGALAKVRELADEFAAYLQDEHSTRITAGPTTTTGAPTMAHATTTIALDLDTVNRATRTISSELAMDRLLSRLMTLLVENAAARRGVLLLNVDGNLRVEAEAISDEEGIRIEVGQGIPAAAYGALPLSIINLVTRTRTDVVLGDAIRDPIHSADAYLRSRQIRSVLCTAISHQGSLTAVLYLENDLAGNVFTHRRLALIRQIAAQVAISLTNARLYDSLNEARIAALAADRAKTRFLMNMSHELRTPLNAILGYTELIAENFAAGETSNIDSDLRSVHRAGIRLLRSVSSILELTRIETDAREAHAIDIDLSLMLPALIETFEDSAALHNNSLHVEAPSPWPQLVTDEHMLRYALTCLLDNACRFTDGGEITLRVAEISRDGTAWIEFSVADTGSGIGEEALPKLFTAFHQVDDSPSRRFEGTGVSLAVTAHFCERMGGAIDVSSTPALGSVFTIRLPQHPPQS
ncbi:MAG TPA: sensor histidine kinase, partial [Nannocystis exedens]|nr:sensor histidine kinase [Nannocystis exedens]